MQGLIAPGQLVIIKEFALVRRERSEEEHYTEKAQVGIVIRGTLVFSDDDDIREGCVVLFSRDLRTYHVPASGVLTLDQLNDPSRLFGRLRGYG